MIKLLKTVFCDKHTDRFSIKHILNFILTIILLYSLLWLSVKRVGLDINLTVMFPYYKRILQGLYLTIVIGLSSFVISLFFGIFIALSKNSRFLLLRYFAVVYVEFIRGTPLMMQIYLFFYIISTAWGVDNRIIAGILILSIFESAYIAEIIRGSYMSLDKIQLEAAKSVGFNKLQTMRYVIVPQMISRTLPALAGQFASIIKDSSLLSIIAVIELMHSVREISATNFRLVEANLLIGLLYLALTLPVSLLSKKLEKRFGYEH